MGTGSARKAGLRPPYVVLDVGRTLLRCGRSGNPRAGVVHDYITGSITMRCLCTLTQTR